MKLPKIHGKKHVWKFQHVNPHNLFPSILPKCPKNFQPSCLPSGDGGIDVVESGNQKTDAFFFGVAGKR